MRSQQWKVFYESHNIGTETTHCEVRGDFECSQNTKRKREAKHTKGVGAEAAVPRDQRLCLQWRSRNKNGPSEWFADAFQGIRKSKNRIQNQQAGRDRTDQTGDRVSRAFDVCEKNKKIKSAFQKDKEKGHTFSRPIKTERKNANQYN